MVPDYKGGTHLNGSSIGTISQLEVLAGPTEHRMRSELSGRGSSPKVLPGAQVSDVARFATAIRL